MKKKKKNGSNLLYNLLLIIALGAFLFSGYQLVSYILEIQAGESLTEELAQSAVVKVEQSHNAAAPKPDDEAVPAETGAAQEEPGPETAPVQVDFDVLWAQNEDVVAWLYCEGTQINYPVAQSGNNSDYLYTLLNGDWNAGGTIFMDYRNTSDCTDWHTLIYGHNMKSGTMFGSIDEYKNQEYYEAHPVWYMMTPEKDYKVELIAGFVTTSDSFIYTFPGTQEEKQTLVQRCISKSNFASDAEMGEEDVIVTFSTCSYEYDDARYVLVGVLRELPRI